MWHYGKGKDIHRNLRGDDLAAEVLARQAKARAKRTGEPFEVSLGVREGVLAALDGDGPYGVWYYNRRDVDSEPVRGGGLYRKAST